MTVELVPSVQAALDLFPEQKKDNFDRFMDVVHLCMDSFAYYCGSAYDPRS